jgi:NAD-dependent dihydropyrimidine dehydrogenase PreA subunit
MKREIINIDKEKCNGCGICVPNCHEGALQIIDNKATLVSELMCDGLGACIGHCPEGAITIEEREAEAYDEILVIKRIMNEGKNVLIAHLSHLKEHDQLDYLKQAVTYLKANEKSLNFSLGEVIERVHNSSVPKKNQHVEVAEMESHQHHAGCPGSLSRSLRVKETEEIKETLIQKSELVNWPIQMHLINPNASYFKNADVLLSADCVSYALGSFHQQFLKGKTLIIACPKLDTGKDIYIQKLKALIDDSNIRSITVLKMEVPCCNGLLQLVQIASDESERKVKIEAITIGINGEII